MSGEYANEVIDANIREEIEKEVYKKCAEDINNSLQVDLRQQIQRVLFDMIAVCEFARFSYPFLRPVR